MSCRLGYLVQSILPVFVKQAISSAYCFYLFRLGVGTHLPKNELIDDDYNIKYNQRHCEKSSISITTIMRQKQRYGNIPRNSIRTAPIRFTILAFTPGSCPGAAKPAGSKEP